MSNTLSVAKRLDATQRQPVSYCVPLWLRDEQIKLAIARVTGRLGDGMPDRSYPKRPESVAVVCFGPSLNETWERIQGFPYVISCSGAHRFLVERGIRPSYHLEVDPRAHKVQLIGPPCPETEYLIASTCHPAVFDHLEGMNVKLWHVFESKEEAKRTLPAGEWALTGGCSVGLRALTMAAFLGFRDLHIFGMDGCEGATGKHAAAHPSQPKGYNVVEYPPGSGIEYRTTPSMLEAARTTWHELDQLPASVKTTFYGEGLVQAMAKDYRPNRKRLSAPIAEMKGLLISPEYAELNQRLHRENLAYGVGGAKHAALVLKIAEAVGTRSILDYGCGKGYLGKELPFGILEYDPAVPGKQESPRPADFVVCTDVLEHVEPELIHHVLQDIARCLLRVGYFVIHTGPAGKTLADGRNTHLLQRDRHWWSNMLGRFFQVGKLWQVGPELHVLVGPKPIKVKRKTSPQPREAIHG